MVPAPPEIRLFHLIVRAFPFAKPTVESHKVRPNIPNTRRARSGDPSAFALGIW